MMDEYSWKIDELITRYELEPSIKDIFVEGRRDQVILRTFFNKIQIGNIGVHKISSVQIAIEDIDTDLDLEEGENKIKVIFLAKKLDTTIPFSNQVICIADKDFDEFLGRSYNNSKLLFTDYSCMEMYFFSKEFLKDFFELYLLGIPYESNIVFSQLVKILQELFLIRLTRIILKLELKWLNFQGCCSFNNGDIDFDSKDFVNRYLNKNNQHILNNAFLSKIEELRVKLKDDYRFQIRGRDFYELLSYYVLQCGTDFKIGNLDAIKRVFFYRFIINDLLNEKLFQSIINWAKN